MTPPGAAAVGDRPSFGIMTPPVQVAHPDLARVWREADAVPEIEHAWLFDHLVPIGGDAHGLPCVDAPTAVAALAEALVVVRRLWAADEPFDHHGEHVDLTAAWCSPEPVQRPGPPIVVGGRATGTLRVAARHADVWNYPGSDVADAATRGAVLDRLCAEVGRDPASVTRSRVVPVAHDRPAATRTTVARAVEAGFRHVVLVLPAPYPEGVARWVADEVIAG